MSAIVFDSLAYVRRVVAAGMPREQAEAQAEAMKEVFVHNIDALVTRDYLDNGQVYSGSSRRYDDGQYLNQGRASV